MMSDHDRKAEDTSLGCRAHSERDLALAEAEPNVHMQERLRFSAAAWAARASLLNRLEGARSAASDQ